MRWRRSVSIIVSAASFKLDSSDTRRGAPKIKRHFRLRHGHTRFFVTGSLSKIGVPTVGVERLSNFTG